MHLLKTVLLERRSSLAMLLSILSVGFLSAQSDTAGWKRVKLFKDDKAIINQIDVDPSWKQLLFKWTCPCDADRTLLLTSREAEKSAQPLVRKRIDIDPEGEVVFDIPDGAATLTISMYGTKCGSSMEVEVLAPIAPPGSETELDFRRTRWGMTRTQVIAGEGTPTVEAAGRLTYVLQIAGLKSALNYDFENGRLSKAEYVLLEKYPEPSQYLVAGATWLDALRERYGEPKQNTFWLNNAYRDDPSKYALAIASGHLEVTNTWQTGRTRIADIVTGGNGAISVRIAYASKQLPSR